MSSAWATASRRSVDTSLRPRSTSERCAGERPASAAISLSVRPPATRRDLSTDPSAIRTATADSLKAKAISSRLTIRPRASAREGRSRRCGDGFPFLGGPGPPPPQLELQALLSACHGPAVVGGEGAVAEERLLGRDPPVIRHVDEVAALPQRPDARALEVAMRDELEARRRRRLGDGEVPAQRVGQPALRVEADHATFTGGIGWLQLLHLEVDRWPPACQPERVRQDVEHLLRRRAQPPVRHE